MNSRYSFARKNYVIFVGVMILLVAGMLTVIADARLEAFHQHHLDITHESLNGVEKQVSFYISEKQRMVEVFAEEQIDWLRALALSPDNDELHENLGKLLKLYFPSYFAFSLADKTGEPLFEDFDGLVGELCLADLKQFSKSKQDYHPYIHPNTESYHFDIMVRYQGLDGKESVFFVSFLADLLGDIVNSIQSPGHEIMLIMPEHKDIIEIVAQGARNYLDRDDYRLSKAEQARISMRIDIPNTRWQAIDFHNEQLHADYRNKLILDSSGTFLVFLIIAVLLVIRLRQEERQREFAEQQKQALMSMVSHEFRTPVSIIKSALDLIADGDAGEISDDVRKYLNMAASNNTHLMMLVNDFLDIQKLEAKGLKFDLHKSQLSDVVRAATMDNKLYAEQFSVRYELKEPLADDIVLCDDQRIGQVLTNLLSNAAKYGGENDTIEITVLRIERRLRVSIRDHGPGIPAQFQSQLFEKFTMNHAAQTNPQKGQQVQSTGLGLSIAKAIIEQHGGRIGFDTVTETNADSPTGTGTSFWFELPAL